MLEASTRVQETRVRMSTCIIIMLYVIPGMILLKSHSKMPYGHTAALQGLQLEVSYTVIQYRLSVVTSSCGSLHAVFGGGIRPTSQKK